MRYPLPEGNLFEYVCCPHYLAEIVIYASLCLLEPLSIPRYAMLAWVISNLAVVSNKQFAWYQDHYSEEVRKKKLKRLIQFIW